MRYTIVFVILLTLLLSGQGRTLTPEAAIASALENNPHMRSLVEEEEISSANYWREFGLPSPTLYWLTEGVDRDKGGFTEKQFGITQQIRFPLTSYYFLSASKQSHLAQQQTIRQARIDLIAGVKSQLIEVAYHYERQRVMRQLTDISEKLNDVVTTQAAMGYATAIDVIKAEIGLANARNLLRSSANEVDKHRYRLFEMIGLPPDEQAYDIRVPDSLPDLRFTIDETELLKQLDNNPLLLQSRYLQQAALNRYRAAWSKLLPDMQVQLFLQNFAGENNFYGWQIGLDIPLWFWTEPRADIRSGRARENQARWLEKARELQVKRDIESAWHSFNTSRQNIDLYRQQIAAKNENLLSLSLEAYASGGMDLVAFLQAQETYFTTELNYLMQQRDYLLHSIELEKYLPAEIIYARDVQE
jgi:cobalt-zinc-cadmium efflux system outer membrane protein